MWRRKLLSEKHPPWLGILAKSSLVSGVMEVFQGDLHEK